MTNSLFGSLRTTRQKPKFRIKHYQQEAGFPPVVTLHYVRLIPANFDAIMKAKKWGRLEYLQPE